MNRKSLLNETDSWQAGMTFIKYINMNPIRLWSLSKKETHRFLKVWGQTVFSPVMVAILYFAVFGGALSSKITDISGISYLAFIVPGLAMLQSTTNAFTNPSSSLIISKYHGTITDLLLPPFSAWEKTLGYLFGGLARGMMVTVIIFLVAFFFVDDFLLVNFWALILIFLLANGIFTILGTLIGIWGKTFDQISMINTFLITPMGFLGGTFYSMEMLPPLAQKISLFNPFLYFVDGARWAFFGQSDLDPVMDFCVAGGIFVMLLGINWIVFRKGWGLQS